MNQELIQKLKDAGFPFKHFGAGIDKDGDLESRPIIELSELIEACGNGFTKLIRGWDGDVWLADGEEGITPEEAVANLWLELNKK